MALCRKVVLTDKAQKHSITANAATDTLRSVLSIKRWQNKLQDGLTLFVGNYISFLEKSL